MVAIIRHLPSRKLRAKNCVILQVGPFDCLKFRYGAKDRMPIARKRANAEHSFQSVLKQCMIKVVKEPRDIEAQYGARYSAFGKSKRISRKIIVGFSEFAIGYYCPAQAVGYVIGVQQFCKAERITPQYTRIAMRCVHNGAFLVDGLTFLRFVSFDPLCVFDQRQPRVSRHKAGVCCLIGKPLSDWHVKVFITARPKPRSLILIPDPFCKSGGLVQAPNLGRSRPPSRRTLRSAGFILRQKSANASLKNARSYTVATETRAMLFVRSLRPGWHHATHVAICRVVTRRLDGLNSRAIRPIPGALLIWNSTAAFQG